VEGVTSEDKDIVECGEDVEITHIRADLGPDGLELRPEKGEPYNMVITRQPWGRRGSSRVETAELFFLRHWEKRPATSPKPVSEAQSREGKEYVSSFVQN